MVDEVHLAGTKRLRLGGDVGDVEALDLVEVRHSLVPVVGIALREVAQPGLELDQDEGPGADTGGLRMAERMDGELVGAQRRGEIRVRLVEPEHHGVLAVRLDLRDGVEGRLDRRGGVLGHLLGVGVHDVLCLEALTVVELHPLAQLERPLCRSVRRLPARRELRDRFIALVDPDDGVRHFAVPGDHERGAAQRITGVEGVRCVAAEARELQAPAPLGGLRHRVSAREHRRDGRGGAHRHHARHEFPPADGALGDESREIWTRSHSSSSYLVVSGTSTSRTRASACGARFARHAISHGRSSSRLRSRLRARNSRVFTVAALMSSRSATSRTS